MGSAASVEDVEMSWGATGTEGAASLQQVAAERLAAHRGKRASAAAQEAEHEAHARRLHESVRQNRREDQRRGARAVRDTVKARYEQRETYREFLASEAERAIGQAQAEADVAARNARAVADAQMQLLEEFDSANQPDPSPREALLAQHAAETRDELAHALADIVLGARELMAESLLSVLHAPAPPLAASPLHAEPEPAFAPETPLREISASGLTVRLFEDLAPSVSRLSETSAGRGGASQGYTRAFAEPERQDALDVLEAEIAFRHAPEFPEYAAVESAPIHGNLIEFPRELVAPRRARPRLAERSVGAESEPQLRIFEVDAAQGTAEQFQAVDGNSVPDWQSGVLESAVVEPLGSPWANSWSVPVEAQSELTLPAYTAPLERRLMSAAVDATLVAAGWLCAAAAAAAVAGPGLRSFSLPLLGAAAAASLLLSAVLFQLLFFTLSGSTPGMRWARIGLCTFGDSNPTRNAMRARVLSNLLAVCPLGLGLAWAFMDNDGLGWHDRMSRMYQRAY